MKLYGQVNWEFIGETVVVMILLGSPERGAGEQSETEGFVP